MGPEGALATQFPRLFILMITWLCCCCALTYLPVCVASSDFLQVLNDGGASDSLIGGDSYYFILPVCGAARGSSGSGSGSGSSSHTAAVSQGGGCSEGIRGATGRRSLDEAHECEERRIRTAIKMWEEGPEAAAMSK